MCGYFIRGFKRPHCDLSKGVCSFCVDSNCVTTGSGEGVDRQHHDLGIGGRQQRNNCRHPIRFGVVGDASSFDGTGHHDFNLIDRSLSYLSAYVTSQLRRRVILSVGQGPGFDHCNNLRLCSCLQKHCTLLNDYPCVRRGDLAAFKCLTYRR